MLRAICARLRPRLPAAGRGARVRRQGQAGDRADPYAGNWNPRPTATRRLAWEIEKRTSIEVVLEPVEVRLSDEAALKRNPFLYLAGDARAADLRRRRRGAPAARTCSRRLPRHRRRRGAAGRRLRPVGARAGGAAVPARAAAQDLAGEHVVYKSFYLLQAPVGRVAAVPYLEGVAHDGRLVVVYSQNDLGGAWARDDFGAWEHEVLPGGDAQRELAFRLGVNLAMYALCLDYKTDQVHVPFILRRRQWQLGARLPLPDEPMTYDEWRVVSLAPWGRARADRGARVRVRDRRCFAWRALRHDERCARRWSCWRCASARWRRRWCSSSSRRCGCRTSRGCPTTSRCWSTPRGRWGCARSRASRRAPSARGGWLARVRRTRFEPLGARARRRLLHASAASSRRRRRVAATTAAGARRDGDATRLREALADLRARYEGRDLGGVVLVSDGVDNGRIGEALGDKGLDVEVDRLPEGARRADPHRVGRRPRPARRRDRARAGRRLRLRAHVGHDRSGGARASAAAAGWDGKHAAGDAAARRRADRVAEVTVEPGVADDKVAFDFTPERVGNYLYEISTPVLDGEALAENNARSFLLKVIRDKIRVLHVAGRPSWDERFLRGLLKRDPNVDLVSFFILRTETD